MIKHVSTMVYYSSLFFHNFEFGYFSCEIEFTLEEKFVLTYFLSNLNSTVPCIMIPLYHVKELEEFSFIELYKK
jgi:hypothetical protein